MPAKPLALLFSSCNLTVTGMAVRMSLIVQVT